MYYVYKYSISNGSYPVNSVKCMILCDEDDHRELHKQIEKTFSGVTIGYYKSKQPINEKDVIYEKTFTLKPIVRTEEPKLSMMMNLLNVLYNNGFVKFTVYEKLWPRLLFFDYDVKDEDVILLDYINNISSVPKIYYHFALYFFVHIIPIFRLFYEYLCL